MVKKATELMLSPREALKNLAGKIGEAEFQALSRVVQKDIVTLATDEAFALRDNSGEIRAFKQRLVLTQKDGTLIQPVPGGPFVISAQGYEVWAEAAGATVILPPRVLVDGQWRDNPHVLRDPNNGRIMAVYARASAFRFSSKGLPQASDWTTIFDVPSYRMIDLLGKAKKFPQAFRLLPKAMEPEDEGTWSRYSFDEASDLWINTSHGEALQWYGSILNREKKSLDFAQTFAKRNSLKHLSGLQKAPGPTWDMAVFCWRAPGGSIIKWDATQYANLQKRVDGLMQGPGDAFDSSDTPPQITAGTELIEDEQDESVDPEDEVIDIGEPPPFGEEPPMYDEAPPERKRQMRPAATMTEEEVKLYKNYLQAKDVFSDEFAQACEFLGIAADEKHSIEEQANILQRINEILDE